jgi:hypothetical protein
MYSKSPLGDLGVNQAAENSSLKFIYLSRFMYKILQMTKPHKSKTKQKARESDNHRIAGLFFICVS